CVSHRAVRDPAFTQLSPLSLHDALPIYEQRRMQVLVDGRTAHRATLSDMDWETMPVPLEVIERIEVARGPNSAAYGINAFLGTIDRKSTRLNSSHLKSSYAASCLKKKI